MRPSLLVAAVALALAGCSSAKPVSGNDAGAACTVDGQTFPAGTFNPNQPCQTCQPAISASVFSTFTGPPPSGGCATSQQVCNAGTCQSGCVIPDLGFEPAGALEAGNACRVCDPSRSTTAWSSLTGAPLDGGCPGANLCLNGQCVSGCLIDGGLITTGTADPTNSCETCQPGTLATGYSPITDATPCQTNGNYCKAGACIFGCDVGGRLFDAGDSSPTNVCDVCAASTVGQPVMAFSPTTVTTQCSENGGTYCAQGACIPVCLIGATFYDAGTLDPTDPDQCCNPATPGAWTPGFASATSIPMGTLGSTVLAVGDVLPGHANDLVIAEGASSAIAVVPGDGGGGFGTAQTVPVGLGPQAIAIGDLNGDNLSDIAVVNKDGPTVTILLQQDGGGFVQPATSGASLGSPLTTSGSDPESIVLADVNGDRILDLIVPNWKPYPPATSTGRVDVWLGNGDGTFQAATPYGTGQDPIAIVAANFEDLPGNVADIATANSLAGSQSITVLHNNQGGFATTLATIGLSATPTALTIADFNADGYPDLAVATSDGNLLVFLNQKATPWFPSTASATLSLGAGASPSSLVAADLNGDGQPDLAATDLVAGAVDVFLNQGGGTFAPIASYAIGATAGPTGLAVGDVNGDGRPDLAIANSGETNASILLGQCP